MSGPNGGPAGGNLEPPATSAVVTKADSKSTTPDHGSDIEPELAVIGVVHHGRHLRGA